MKSRTFLFSLMVACAASVLVAQDRTTTSETKQATVQNPDGSVTVTGEVIRYEPGRTIVIRRSNKTETTYTLDPGVTVPSDVQIGRQVTLVTQTQDGTVHIRKVTTTSTSSSQPMEHSSSSMENPGSSAMAPSQSETQQTTTETRSTASVAPANPQTAPDASGNMQANEPPPTGQNMQTSESTSTMTTVTGTVRTYQPGQSITIIGPDRKVTTYTISEGVDVPQDVTVGKRVTIETTTVSGKPVVKSVTTKTVKTKTKTVSPK